MTHPQNTPYPSPTLTQSIPPLLSTIFQAADDRKGGDIQVLQVTEVSYLADYFVIMTGFSRTQVKAIADAILDKVETQYEKSPLRVEGIGENSWIVMDYGDVIIHIFLPEEREFYNLEAFWGHAQPIDVSLLKSVH
ncbi:MAG: ribosome silencing factor [Microcystaceae cyanobacterium]